MAIATPIDTARLRDEEFPLTRTWAYLNHASVGPFPQRTVRALDEINRAFTAPNVWEAENRGAQQEYVRTAIAGLAGAQPERVAITSSLAHGISIAAAGIQCSDGDEVIVPHSEYPSLALPFLAQEARGLRVRWVPKNADGRTDLNAIEAAINERTRAVALSHVEFADGFRNDLQTLGALCRAREVLLIVDATQSLGAVEIDVDGWGVHCIAAHGYKWVHAGFGIGLAVFSEEGIERIRPTHAGSQSICVDGFVPEQQLVWQPGARRYETGSQPYTLVAGLAASLTLIDEVGMPNILPHTLRLLDRLKRGVEERGYDVVSSWEPSERSQIVAISGGSREADERLNVTLTEAGVATALRPKGLRVAPSFYSDESDIDRLVDALPPR
jgi:cysteine desulfurase/selenocysteine lyase